VSDPLPPPTQSLHRLIAGFVRQHGRAYVGSGLMLVGVAVLTVLIPRQVGRIIDGLVDGSVRGETALLQVLLIVAMGAAIYFLRVGWRLMLFSAAYRLGVELRTRLYRRFAEQGPPFFRRQRTGDLMARATNDVDAVEMAAGEAFLAAFDGTLTLVLVVAMMTLGIDWRLGLVALLPFPLMALAFWVISRRVHDAWADSLARFSTLNEHVQETIAGVRSHRAHAVAGRLAGLAARADGGPVDGLHHVSGPVDLADVRGRLGAVAVGARQGSLDPAGGGAGGAAQRGRHRRIDAGAARRAVFRPRELSASA
jgi:ATP-binding cassette subfamily B protein/ATP-binding cassette subfamily C protein/ATP-binding cassette subfamily B multidrug efflux pump